MINLNRILVPTDFTTTSEAALSYGIALTRADVVGTFDDQFAKLPKLHFAIADSARHFIMYDDPQWFFAELDRFLNNPEQAARTRGFEK